MRSSNMACQLTVLLTESLISSLGVHFKKYLFGEVCASSLLSLGNVIHLSELDFLTIRSRRSVRRRLRETT